MEDGGLTGDGLAGGLARAGDGLRKVAAAMKVALVETVSRRPECVNKDFMGGYGWAFSAGTSLPARAIGWVKRVGEKVPIMSFGYLASLFARAGHDVVFTHEVVSDVDLAVIYATMVDYSADRAMAERYRRETRATVAFVGPFATYEPEALLDVADVIVSGEPEHYAATVAEGGPVGSGLVSSPNVDDLDTLPFPDWRFFPLHTYSYFPALRQRPVVTVLASRGCPYKCEYCPYEIIRWRHRCADNVVAELEYLRRDFGVRGVIFRDPIFSVHRQRTADLMEMMVRRGLKLRWACETRMDCLDEELLTLMHRAGLRVLNVAIESSNDSVLTDVSRRPIATEQQERIVNACERLGIRVTVFYVLGLPEDTRDSIRETVRYAKQLNTHVAQFFVYTPFPGTVLYDRVKRDITGQRWEQFDCYTPVVKHPKLTDQEILRLKEWAFVSYYFRPAYLGRLAVRAARDLLS